MPKKNRRHLARRISGVEALEPRQLMAVDVAVPLTNLTVSAGSAAETIDLSQAFNLADVTGTVVRFDTNVAGGSFYAELFDQAGAGRTRTTPRTAANFLEYVANDLYTDTIVHRSVPRFIVQGGGFSVPTATGSLPAAITTFAPVVNEPGNTNVRGTMAMAKLGGDPNSATNQWFVNLDNNAANLDAQNGGFTVFARVLGDGMDVVDAMAALPTTNLGGAFTDLPVVGSMNAGGITPANFLRIAAVSPVEKLVYAVTSSDPSIATATVREDGSLRLDFAATGAGTSTITVRASSVFDPADFTEEQFVATLLANSPVEPPVTLPVTLPVEPPVIAVGADVDGLPWVTVLDATSGDILSKFLAFHPANRGGVAVALGDVDGDGIDEVIAASGAGTRSVVKFFELDGTHMPAYRTLPFDKSYLGGLNIASGDFDGNRVDDLAVVSARGAGLAKVYLINPAAADPVPDQASITIRQAFPGSIGGTTVAAADVGTFTGGRLVDAAVADGRDELVLGSGVGIPPLVRIYDVSVAAPVVVRTLRPLSASYLGGLNVSSGRYNADAIDDIIVTGGRRSGSAVEVHSGRVAADEVLLRRAAFASLASLPTYAAGLDIDGDGRIDSLVATQGGGAGSGVRLLGGTTGLQSAFSSLSGGFRVAATRQARLQSAG